MKKRSEEIDFLLWFYQTADFGPADGDVRDNLKNYFMKETNTNLPKGYNFYSDGETCTDEE